MGIKSQQTQFIIGPAGRQEVLISIPNSPQRVTCIICHPHPVHGGTMHNKVVYTLASAMDQLSIKSVRFNFRGVQKSEGEFDNGIGELEDLCHIVEWVKTEFPSDDIWLAGFSFGAGMAFKAHQQCAAKNLIVVAPPVGQPYFLDTPEIRCPWLLVQGEQDEVIDPKKVFAWAKCQLIAPECILMAEAGHFFHGRLIELREKIVEHFKS